jgi:hypothetical protein
VKWLEDIQFAPISAEDRAEIARIFEQFKKKDDAPNVEVEEQGPKIQRTKNGGTQRSMGGRKPNADEVRQRQAWCEECGAIPGSKCAGRKRAHHMRGRGEHCGSQHCSQCNHKFGNGLEREWKAKS